MSCAYPRGPFSHSRFRTVAAKGAKSAKTAGQSMFSHPVQVRKSAKNRAIEVCLRRSEHVLGCEIPGQSMFLRVFQPSKPRFRRSSGAKELLALMGAATDLDSRPRSFSEPRRTGSRSRAPRQRRTALRAAPRACFGASRTARQVLVPGSERFPGARTRHVWGLWTLNPLKTHQRGSQGPLSRFPRSRTPAVTDASSARAGAACESASRSP